MFGMSAGATTLSRSTTAAANAGALSRPLPLRTRVGIAQAPPSLNLVHPSGDVQLNLMPVDLPPLVRDTCNVDVELFYHLTGCVKGMPGEEGRPQRHRRYDRVVGSWFSPSQSAMT